MGSAFYVNLVLSFLVGGIWVTLATVVAERFGSKVGGVIGGTPTTIVIALFFIGLVQGPAVAVEATSIVPAAFSASCIFMLIYAAVVAKGLWPAIGSALFVWLVLQWVLVFHQLNDFWLSSVVCIVLLIISTMLFERVLRIRSHDKVAVRYTMAEIIGRAFFAGVIVAFSVFMSKAAGSLWGGVFASFPAIFITTLVITYRSVSPEFSRSICKTHMISGVLNCVVYAAGVRYAYPGIGLVWGTLAAYLLSIFSSYLTYLLVRRVIS